MQCNVFLSEVSWPAQHVFDLGGGGGGGAKGEQVGVSQLGGQGAYSPVKV